MKLIDKINKLEKAHFSFELLPPLKGKNIDSIYALIDNVIDYDPVAVNITYHQEEVVYERLDNGLLQEKTIRKRPGTVAISAAIKYKYENLPVVPHIICGGFSNEETEYALIDLHFLGIQNILVLRGDPLKSQRYFKPHPRGYANAVDMVKQVTNLNKGIYLDENLENTAATDFSIGVAGYPEKHFEAPNMDSDLKYLKEKVDAGADYIVTQMFFDNQKYFDFVKKCRDIGIKVPVIPGIKPINSKKDLQMLPQVFHIDIPQDLVSEVAKCKDKAAVKQAGVEWAVEQSRGLLEFGVPLVHYFTIGKTDNLKAIVKKVF